MSFATQFVVCSPVETLRANFFISLHLLGKTDEEINRRYADALPASGEAQLAAAFVDLKAKYLPFAGFLLARYTPGDFNVKGLVEAYATKYNLTINVSSYRKVCARILEAYSNVGDKGFEGVDICSWGRKYWGV